MSDPKIRSGVRKKASLRLGRRVVSLDVGATRELFTLNEDLVCISPFFRNILQPRRKAIEGECSICHEELRQGAEELTHCSASCGNNFHWCCMEGWQGRTPIGGVVKCPLCRQPWELTERWVGVYQLPTLNSDAFEVYFEWLYKSCIPTGTEREKLIHAYFLGERIEAQDFCNDILVAIIVDCVEEDTYPPASSIRLAYNHTHADSPLRELVVGLFMQLSRTRSQRASQRWGRYPTAFTQDLVHALMEKCAHVRVAWEVDALKAELLS